MVLLVNEEKYNELIYKMGALTSAMLLCYEQLPSDVQKVLKEQGVISNEQHEQTNICAVGSRSTPAVQETTERS